MPLSKAEKQKLIAKLFDTDSQTVSSSIKSIKEEGDKDFIVPLMDFVQNTQDFLLQEQGAAILSELKDSPAISIFLENFSNEKYNNVHHLFLSAIWNGNYDACNYIEKIVRVSLNGSFEAPMECLTILENIEGTYPEEQLLEAQILCKGYLKEHESKQEATLVKDILEKLEQIDQNQ